MSIQAQRIVLASRPQGAPRPENFRLESFNLPAPGPGQVLLKVLYLSLDPYMRGRMSDAKSYAKPVAIGESMVGGTVAQVLRSEDPAYAPGDIVLSYAGWQSHALVKGEQIQYQLDPAQGSITASLGLHGMPGFTAWAGLTEIGKPRPGETVVVAAASGPVGAAVAQIARLRGARAVGIAGGAEKCAYLRDTLKLDAALDHRAADFPQQLAAACPDGIDVYFENVGGAVWNAVMPLLNAYARVPVCGVIAHYNDTAQPAGPDRLPSLMALILRQSLTVRGFIQVEFLARYPEFLKEMGGWLREGKIQVREHVIEGLEQAPQGLIELLTGGNFGKTLVHIADPD